MIALVIGVIVIGAASWWLTRVGGLLFSQVITLYITPVIYLYLDRYSGKGPITVGVSPRVQATT